MTDPIETLMALRDRIDKIMEQHAGLEEKQKRERAILDAETIALNKDVAIASAIAVLRDVAADCKHERARVKANGVREMLHKALIA